LNCDTNSLHQVRFGPRFSCCQEKTLAQIVDKVQGFFTEGTQGLNSEWAKDVEVGNARVSVPFFSVNNLIENFI